MKEELQNKILEQVGDVAELGKEGLMKAVEVMQEQCPLLVEELLRWEMLSGVLFFAIGLLVLLAGIKVTMWTHKNWADIYEKDTETFHLVVCAVLCVLGFLMVIGNGFAWLKIWIAPRLFLLEYVSELIK